MAAVRSTDTRCIDDVPCSVSAPGEDWATCAG
jgi:hypothetical protein